MTPTSKNKQVRNARWLVFGMILLFSFLCLSLCENQIFGQHATKQSIEQLDRSRFSITAQNIEYNNESQNHLYLLH